MACGIQREKTRNLPCLVSTNNYDALSIIYLSFRNFAATQTKGVSCAIYKKYPSKAAAEAAFEDATRDGFVQIL